MDENTPSHRSTQSGEKEPKLDFKKQKDRERERKRDREREIKREREREGGTEALDTAKGV